MAEVSGGRWDLFEPSSPPETDTVPPPQPTVRLTFEGLKKRRSGYLAASEHMFGTEPRADDVIRTTSPFP